MRKAFLRQATIKQSGNRRKLQGDLCKARGCEENGRKAIGVSCKTIIIGKVNGCRQAAGRPLVDQRKL